MVLRSFLGATIGSGLVTNFANVTTAVGQVARIEIENSASGYDPSSAAVLISGSVITQYCVGYDADANYTGLINGDWSLSG